jgi:hypothetical protein
MLNIDLEFAVSQHYFLAGTAGLTCCRQNTKIRRFQQEIESETLLAQTCDDNRLIVAVHSFRRAIFAFFEE